MLTDLSVDVCWCAGTGVDVSRYFYACCVVVLLGVDPKSIICEFFKKGSCRKGKKCKFSHDWNQVRRTEKIDLYTDPRENQGKFVCLSFFSVWFLQFVFLVFV